MAKDTIVNEVTPDQFFKNKEGSVLKIKDIEHNLVIFDEEGKEHALPMAAFYEYINQEEYKEQNTKTKKIVEVIEGVTTEAAIRIFLASSLNEAAYSAGDVKKAKGVADKIQGDFAKGYAVAEYAIKNIKSISNSGDLEAFVLKVLGKYGNKIEDGVWEAWAKAGN